MSDPNPAPASPALSLKQTAQLLSDQARWIALRELAKGEALPVQELAARAGRSREAMSKHMIFMRRLGMVVTSYGGHYKLAPALRPAPGATTIDLGHGLIRLDAPA